MVSLLPFLLLLLPLPPSTIANDPYKLCEGNNFSTNTTFQSNLNLLLSSLSSKTNSTFATDTQGSPPDIIYGLFLCRGDVNRSTCQNCIRNATRNILQLCPYSRQATVWYDTCQLRYSDLSFFATFHEDNPVTDSDKQKAKDSETFNRIRKQLFEKLSDEAANNSTLMFATGTADIGVSENVMYGLVQCTRDLSKEGCHLCLQENFYDMSQYMESQNAIGVRILAKSCNFRFETYKFFEGDPVISLSARPNAEADGRGNRKIIIVSIVISLLVASVFILSVCIIFRRRQAKSCQGIADPNEISMESLYFELPVLKAATSNFSDVNKLGQGGFGAVYKGMLPNGQDIAVKRLSANSKQGIEELKNELLLVAKLQHSNLVRLRGVCLEAGEKLLVYEYMANGSLDQLLFGIYSLENKHRQFQL